MHETRRDDTTGRPFASLSGSDRNALPPELCAALAPRYTVLRVLGRGGSAVVYLAHDGTRGSDVALKVLHDALTSQVSTTRFLREVDIARGLDHPHIVPVFESGSVERRAYYTMPYVEGQSLRERLQREPQCSLEDTIAIARQVADALDYAHAHGIVHRDVKPANILMSQDRACVADFGVARAMVIASGDTITDSGFALGTPEYMSPEQAAGQRELDGRSDVYALACVVYQMLAGEPPFTGPSAQAIIARHFQEAPRSLRVVRPSVPRSVERAIERALEKVPADRYATAGEFVDALTAPATADDVELRREAATMQRRTVRRLAIIAVVLGLVVTGVARAVLASAGTTSFRARTAFLAGYDALHDGRFARADSQFADAIRHDPRFARAMIWSSLVHWWIDAEAPPSPLALRTAMQPTTRRMALDSVDALLLAGLVALAERREADACAAWADGTRAAFQNPVVLYSLGTCLRRDPIVLADATSPSGWRFRASHERAIVAYEQAFELQPLLLRGLGTASLADLQELFRTNSARMRDGRARSNDTLVFRAFPELSADTLRYVPYPRQIIAASAAPSTFALAIQHERERLLRTVRIWSTGYPRDPMAARAVAVALDLLGDAAAPDAFQTALALAESTDDSLSIAAEAVLVRIKHALPDDTFALRRAVVTADSLLRAHPPAAGREVGMLGALAALLGRASLSADYARRGGVGSIMHALTGSGPSLLAYASLGGPRDSLAKYEALVEAAVSALPPRDGGRARGQWLWRSAALSYPDYAMRALASRDDVQASVLEPIVAAVAGDNTRVIQLLARLQTTRATLRPADIMIEGLYQEAVCLVTADEPRSAIARIDPTLNALRYTTTRELGQIPRTGALVRAMALRATLAQTVGEPAASRRWARAVIILWSGADEFLQHTVRDMTQLAH